MKKKLPLNTTPVTPRVVPPFTQSIAQPSPLPAQGPIPTAPVSGGLSKKNQQWFAELEKSMTPIRVVPPPVPGQTFVPGFPVRCHCVALNFMTPKSPDSECKSCGGRGFVIVAKG